MALPPPVLRRTAAAHRHSPRHRAHSGSDRLRRGAVGARRLDPGAGDRAPEGAAKKIRLFLSLHRPRSAGGPGFLRPPRSEEHTSELQSLMRISYAVFCLKKKIR